MLTLLFLLLAAYTIVIQLPLTVPRTPQVQGILGTVCACVVTYCLRSRIGLIFYSGQFGGMAPGHLVVSDRRVAGS